MPTARPVELPRPGPWALVVPLLFGLVGLWIVFHVQVASGFERMQPDRLDPRLVHYTLERNHRWLFAGGMGREPFWSPPFFYPEPGVGALTESMLGLQPFYSPWRGLGVAPETAYQLTALGLLLACFAAAYAVFRRAGALAPAAAGLAAFLFAFALPRSAQLGHIQLFAHYATPVVLLGLHQAFAENAGVRRRRAGVALFYGSFCLQVLGSIYLAWFLALALGLGGLVAAGVPRLRRPAVQRFVEVRWAWLVGGAITLGTLLLFLQPYFAIHGRVDLTSQEAILPRAQSWLFGGWGSWEFQALGITDWWRIESIPFVWEQALSPGLFTLALASWGLWQRRRSALGLLVLSSAGLMVALLLRWPGGFTLWPLVTHLVPGAEAIRAVSRIGLLLLLPVGLGVAWAWEAIRRQPRFGGVAAGLMAAAVIVEQGQTQPSFEKRALVERVRTLAALLPPGCTTFLYTPLPPHASDLELAQLDAMFASLEAGVPTLNGYSGYAPAGWWQRMGLYLLDFEPPERLDALAVDLRRLGAGVDRLCWLRVAIGSRGVRGGTLAWTAASGRLGEADAVVVESFGAPEFSSPRGGRIFRDGFESGDLMRWSMPAENGRPFDPGSGGQ